MTRLDTIQGKGQSTVCECKGQPIDWQYQRKGSIVSIFI